jgi:hypothetical protein
LIDSSTQVGLEVNAERTVHMHNITSTILGIIHYRFFYLKCVSETGLCFRLQEEPTQGFRDRVTLSIGLS